MDKHLEIAYWSVLKDLEPAAGIDIAKLKIALPKFLASTGASAEAAIVIRECLFGIAWYWPSWNDFAKKAGYETLETIAISISRIRPAELLNSLTVPELVLASQNFNINHKPRAKKTELISELLKVSNKEDLHNFLQSVRSRLYVSQSDLCRNQMAQHIASRILSIANTANRYEQLIDSQLLTNRPFWRFVWGGATDIDAPKMCRKFDGKLLRCSEALQRFPKLPCNYLKCSCYINADRGDYSHPLSKE